jgi:hypothetical protein
MFEGGFLGQLEVIKYKKEDFDQSLFFIVYGNPFAKRFP